MQDQNISDYEQYIQQPPFNNQTAFSIYSQIENPQPKIHSESNSYQANISELISEPIEQNHYSMEYIYRSLYWLSSYLWNKKIIKHAQYNISNSIKDPLQISFDEYLLPIQQELFKYDRFKRNKFREQQQIHSLISTQQSKYPEKKLSLSFQQNNLQSLQSQLIKCYQQVPYIYFEQTFSLDFSNFYDKQNRDRYNSTQKMKLEQQKMNNHLDLIQINLFGQIHRKFQEYFKAAANFDYLKQSVDRQLNKLQQTRKKINKIQTGFVQKSALLRKKIVERGNYEKLIKKLKLIKSLKKLPSIIQTILQSSLPYECLELLQSTKKSISQLKQIDSVQKIISNIQSSEALAQFGLNKRYSDKLYLYIEEAFESINICEQFRKMTTDCPIVQEKEQNSTLNNFSRRRQNFQESSFKATDRSGFFVLDDYGESKGSNFAGRPLLKNTNAKREQAKQYEIAMILLQSYEYVDFPVDVTKIKISNGLRLMCRKFEKNLVDHLQVQLQIVSNQSDSMLLNELSKTEGILQIPADTLDVGQQKPGQQKPNKQHLQTGENIYQNINIVSVEYYTRHICVLNDLFKESLNRYLGYIQTLVIQYEQKLFKEFSNAQKSIHSIQSYSEKFVKSESQIIIELQEDKSDKKEKSQKIVKIQDTHIKFKKIFAEELSVLPSIFKIIQEKIKHFLTLKNLSNATPQQFFQWISLIRFWQRWFDILIQDSLLLNYSCHHFVSNTQTGAANQLITLGQNMMSELINIAIETIKKSLCAMSLKNLIKDLTVSYLNSYAINLSSQLELSISNQIWQSVEIPQQFSDILNGILISKPSVSPNTSLTILNFSNSQISASFNQDNKQSEKSINAAGTNQFRYKILKNNVLLEGQRYKLTISFLLLCEFIDELIRVGKQFEGITGETEEQAVQQSKHIKFIISHLYSKIYQLIDFYNSSTKEMILEKKALKLEKIKGNNITVKHICLLSNCLTFLQKLTTHIPQKQMLMIVNRKQQQSELIRSLVTHNTLLIDKISSILNKKMQNTASSLKLKQQQKSLNLSAFVSQNNQVIVSLFLQITEIIDEHLDFQKCEKILKPPFQIFVQRYFKPIALKGDKFAQEARVLLQKMKFLKKYFKNQFIAMQRDFEE